MCPERRSKIGKIPGVFFFLLLLSMAFSGMISCGGGSSDSTVSAQTASTSIGSMTVGDVAAISFSSSDSAQVTFSALTGSEEFVVAFSSLSTTPSKSYSASLTSSVSAGLHQSLASQSPLLAQDQPEDSEDATSAFHAFLRNAESVVSVSEPLPDRSSMAMRAASLRENLSVGDSVSLKVLNSLSSTSSYSTITATVAYISSNYIAYLDSSASSTLSNSEIQSLVNNLESKSTLTFSTFGSVSDIDGNGKVGIIFSPVLNALGGSGGIVTGFFFAGDLYPASFSSSNGGEYIYCHVPDENGTWGSAITKSFYLSNTGPLCLPHELQHAINYNMRVFENGGSSEAGAFNEGQSHLAEDVYNSYASTGEENPSRVNLCFGSQLASFISGTNLAQRGCSYLFYRYLYEQADLGRFSGVSSGVTLMRAIHNSTSTGLDAVAAATGESISTLTRDFFTTLYVSNTGLSSSSTYNFSGINLRAAQDDNRGTTLEGPTTSTVSSLPVSGSISSMSANYYVISGTALRNAGSTLTLSGASGSSPGAMLIRTQ